MITIYSIGDADFMIYMAQAAERVFSDGGIGVSKLPAIGLAITLFIGLIKQITDPSSFHLKHFFFAIMMFVFIMTPRANVVIESARTGQTSSVIRLPFGIAAGAWLATGIGTKLAEGLNDGYRSVHTGLTMSSIGVSIEPLRAILRSRGVGTFEAITSAGDTNTVDNFDVYFKDCVFRDIVNKRTSAGQGVTGIIESSLFTGPFDWNNFLVESNGTWFVDFYEGGVITPYACEDAHQQLANAIDPTGEFAQRLAQEAYMSSASSDQQVSRGLEMLMSASADASDFYVNNFVKQLYDRAKATSTRLDQAEVLASQIHYEAMQKRRLNQATQSTFWLETAPTLLTWFESFIFLLAPLIPFLVALGEKGMGMVVKYFYILIGVNMWPVVQVGVNAYLEHNLQRLMCGTAADLGEISSTSSCLLDPELAQWSIQSWGGMDATYTTLETFVSNAAIIQTLVPAFALMIIYGSVHTMINSVNKAQVGATPNTNQITPDAIMKNDGSQIQSGYSGVSWKRHSGGYSQQEAITGNSAVDGALKFDVKDSTKNAHTDAVKQLEQVSQQRSHAVNTIAGDITSAGSASSGGDVVNVANKHGMTTSRSQALQGIEASEKRAGQSTKEAYGQTLKSLAGMEESEMHSFAKALAGRLGITLGSGAAGQAQGAQLLNSTFGIGAGVNGTVTYQNVKSTAEKTSNAMDVSNTGTISKDKMLSFGEKIQQVDSEQFQRSREEAAARSQSGEKREMTAFERRLADSYQLAEQVAQSSQRVAETSQQLGSLQESSGSTSGSFPDALDTRDSNRSEPYTTSGKFANITASALDRVFSAKHGEAWSALKSDNGGVIGALTSLNRGEGDSALLKTAKDVAPMLNVATDSSAARAVTAEALSSVGYDAPNVRKANAVFNAFEAVAGQAKNNTSTGKAAYQMFLGEAFTDVGKNGTATGRQSSILMGEQFIKNAEIAAGVPNKPLTLNENERATVDKVNGEVEQTGKVIEAKAAKIDANYEALSTKYKNGDQNLFTKATAAMDDFFNKDRLEELQVAKGHGEQIGNDLNKLESHLQTFKSAMGRDFDQIFEKFSSKINADAANAGVNDLFSAMGNHLKDNAGFDADMVDRAVKVLKDTNLSPEELKLRIDEEMNSPRGTAYFSEMFGDASKGRQGAIIMGEMALRGSQYLDKVGDEFKSRGNEMPEHLQTLKTNLSAAGQGYLANETNEPQMLSSRLLMNQARQEEGVGDDLAFSAMRHVARDGGLIENSNYLTSNKHGPFETPNYREFEGQQGWQQKQNLVESSRDLAVLDTLVSGLEDRKGELTAQEQTAVENMRADINESLYGVGGTKEKPAEGYGLVGFGQEHSRLPDSFSANLPEFSKALTAAGLMTLDNQNNTDLVRGADILSYGDKSNLQEPAMVNGRPRLDDNGNWMNQRQVLNEDDSFNVQKGEALASHFGEGGANPETFLWAIDTPELRQNVAEGLASHGVQLEHSSEVYGNTYNPNDQSLFVADFNESTGKGFGALFGGDNKTAPNYGSHDPLAGSEPLSPEGGAPSQGPHMQQTSMMKEP